MGLFRRRESLHERLAREGGLLEAERPPHDTTPRWGEAGIHGVQRPRQWDAMAVVDAPGPAGDEVAFTALPDGVLLVGDDVDAEAMAPLAEALESTLSPPYRAVAVRRGEERWAVAGRAIEVVELPDVAGDEIVLTVNGEGERTVAVDGMPSFGGVPALERLAGERFGAYAVHAERLDGRLWEVRIAPL